jgi:1-acyl-sn-glycerol-3-phosphate acyltransferase
VPSAEPTALSSLPAEASAWRGGLRAIWDYFAMATGLLYWAVFGLLFTLIGGPLHLRLPKRTGEAFGRELLHRAFRVFVRLLRVLRLVDADLRSLDRLKSLDHPFILAPNHLSLWDAVFLIARLPRAVCVMKESILLNPFLGGGARLAGYIPNGTTGRMIREAADALHAGGRLLLFPEATRTCPDVRWINPLKGGCALVALRANVPVIPVFIRSDSRFAEKGWPLWKRPRFPIAMEFELGEPLHPEPGDTSQAFTARLQAVYERELSKPHPLRREAGV